MSVKKPERVNRELIHKGGIINYYQDTVGFENGNTEVWDIIEHKGCSAVLPITEDGKIVCVHQYRYAIGKYTIEIPAGGIDPNESFMDCAAREMEEETGYECLSIEPYLQFYSTVGFCNEKIHIFKALVRKKGDQHLDPNESVEVKEYEVEELIEKIRSLMIEDGKTIASVMAYACEK